MRANGPYKQGNKFRLVLSPPPIDGGSRYLAFESERECQAAIDKINEAVAGRTCGSALGEYLVHLGRFGGNKKRAPLRKTALDSVRHRVTAMLRIPESDRPLAAVTPTLARRMYRDRVQEVKTDTHRGELSVTRVFFDWMLEQGWVKTNPFEGIQPEGVRSAGKPTLTIDQSRVFLRKSLDEGTPEGLACALLLLLGLRASELSDRVVGDVDDGGRVLIVPRGKTRAARRALVIPEVLRARVQEQIGGRDLGAPLFELTRYGLHYHVVRLCEASGVARVSPHGLRGSAATNALEVGGRSVEDVARALGHENAGITRAAYIAPGAEESAIAARKADLLATPALPVAPRPTPCGIPTEAAHSDGRGVDHEWN